MSRVGLWNKYYEGDYERKIYGDVYTAKAAGEYLSSLDVQTIEDWGCGYGGFQKFIREDQTYVGVDGSNTKFANVIADLELYTSSVDAIHMRHILEHNPNWRPILDNALGSFRKKMVLTLFTPFQDQTRELSRYPFNGSEMVDIGFLRDEIVSMFKDIKWTSKENLRTATVYNIEHMFFLER